MASAGPSTSSRGAGPRENNGDHVTTLQTVLTERAALEAEAREIMPYAFDECTYSKGPLKQSVWACLDCEGKGVCYSCSLSCHAGCRLVELFQRRKFTCDCPTACSPFPEETLKLHKRCTLYKGKVPQPMPANEGNTYGPNFQGVFCRCGRPYDPQTEEESMIACLACEDWYHESCLNLQDSKPPAAPTKPPNTLASLSSSPDQTSAAADQDDEDDDESPVLPSSAYEHMICGACVRKYPILQQYAGTNGWMMVVPAEQSDVVAAAGANAPDFQSRWRVVGSEVAEDARGSAGAVASTSEFKQEVGQSSLASSCASLVAKRKLHVDDSIAPAKRHKVENNLGCRGVCTLPPASKKESTILGLGQVNTSSAAVVAGRGKGDVFLAEDALSGMCRCDECAPQLASLPFPLEEEDIYEPPLDHEPEQDLDTRTAKALDALPRSQALESIMKYNEMKSRLKAFLEPFSAEGRVVSAEDINDFWETIRNE